MSKNEAISRYLAKSREQVAPITFDEYMERVKKTPTIASMAHKRIYDMIVSHGIEYDKETEEIKYKFFETELFGVEDSTRQIMEYLEGAALGSEVSRRFLLLYGPPSSGKSCLLTMLKKNLERWSQTDQGAVYSIVGCPMHEDPLNAIPKTIRKEVSKELGVDIEGDLCPACAHKLRHEHDGDFTKFQAQRILMSESNRCGIGTFAPSDSKSQDISELIGGIDLSKVADYGDESDPRAYKFNGELNISNRGLMEFIEILKCDQKFLYVLLTATQEKVIKTPRYPLIYIDEAIIAHTNESEYRDFMGNPKNEALIDRMIVCKVKYNLKVEDEIKIYQKLLGQGDMDDVHIAPHTLRVAAMFAVLSRLEDPKDRGMDKVKKMKLYNDQDVEGFSRKDVPRLKKSHPTEGMDGVSPRYVINRLVTTAIRAPQGANEDGSTRRKYITPIEAMRALRDGLQTSSKFKPEAAERYEQILQLAKQEFDVLARNEVQKAFFVSFESEARTLMDNYLDHVESYLEKSTIKDPLTHEEVQPDEKLMRSIETKIGISENEKDSFRNEIMRKVAIATRSGKRFGYEEHARLREAIEKELFEAKREIIKMTISSRTMKDPEQLKRINQVVKVLCDEHGYIPESANDLLKYVSSMMAREK